MASVAQWVEGARPRTLPNAIAPVIAGTGAAAWLDGAVAMIIGVNYANDYSDGIRGTDDVRAGPLRLVGSRLATPRSVLTAAMASFGVAAAAGLALAIVSQPWLIVVGGLCIASTTYEPGVGNLAGDRARVVGRRTRSPASLGRPSAASRAPTLNGRVWRGAEPPRRTPGRA